MPYILAVHVQVHEPPYLALIKYAALKIGSVLLDEFIQHSFYVRVAKVQGRFTCMRNIA